MQQPYISFPSLTAVHSALFCSQFWTLDTKSYEPFLCNFWPNVFKMKDKYHHMYISINSLCSMHFQISLEETFNQTQAWAPGFDTTEFNLCLIRPEDFTSLNLTTECFFGKLQTCCHVPFYQGVASVVPLYHDDDGCPSEKFSPLHRGTVGLSQSNHQALLKIWASRQSWLRSTDNASEFRLGLCPDMHQPTTLWDLRESATVREICIW